MTVSTTPQRPRLLIVEDDPDMRETLAMALGEEDYDVELASTLESALSLVDRYTFELILTDLFATNAQDPLDTATPLVRAASPTPVGVMTGWPVTDEQIARYGFRFYIPKPFDLDDLLARVGAQLRQTLAPEHAPLAERIRAFFAAVTAHDWDGVARLCTDDVTYILPGSAAFAQTITGRAAVRQYIEERCHHFPPTRYDHIRVFALPDGFAARYETTWTLPDGRERGMAGGAVFRFQGDLVSQVSVQLNDQILAAAMSGR